MFTQLTKYQAALPSLWQGRTDTTQAERLFQKIEFIQTEAALNCHDKKNIFIGFASDTGVRRNSGRPGAHLGPDQIKTQLAKLPWSNKVGAIDLGSIVCDDDDLESAQQQLAQIIEYCHQKGHRTIILGGGHEIAWGHFQGLTSHYPRLGIINFDAHFDLRPYHPGQPGTSGTPFSQIAHYCAMQQKAFAYYCVGIQHFGNTPSLFQRAHELNVSYLSAETVHQTNLQQQYAALDAFIQQQEHIYLTICLDVFAECYAPGVSAPQPLGLTPWQIVPLLKYIMQSGKVVSLDLAELSPPLDQEQKTSRLAALIIAELLKEPTS